MFGIFTGTLANAALVILGGVAGSIFRNEKLRQIGDRIKQAFGCFIIVLGVEGAMGISEPIMVLASLIIGIALGEIWDIDDKFNRLGNWMQSKFAKGSDSSSFSKGFVSTSLIFCIGSMSIMGALEAGLQNQHTIYLTKGVIDCVTGLTVAMSAGISVAFSAISVIVYQGTLTVCASFLAPVLSPEIVTLSVQVGSLFLVAIGLNLLEITEIKVANFMPAMFIPMIYQAICLLMGIA